MGSIDELTPAILTKSDNVAEIGKLPITDAASSDRKDLINRDAGMLNDLCLGIRWLFEEVND